MATDSEKQEAGAVHATIGDKPAASTAERESRLGRSRGYPMLGFAMAIVLLVAAGL